MITYDAEQHRLWNGDTEYLSVSSIPRLCGMTSFRSNGDTSYWLDRGTKVHKLIELYEKGELDEERTPEELLAWLPGWKDFRGLCPGKVAFCEEQIIDDEFLIFGTPDIGIENPDGSVSIFDVKTGNHYQSYEINLAGYESLVTRRMGKAVKNLAAVYLSPGNFNMRAVKVSDRETNLKVFHNAVVVARYKRFVLGVE